LYNGGTGTIKMLRWLPLDLHGGELRNPDRRHWTLEKLHGLEVAPRSPRISDRLIAAHPTNAPQN
jgi:hypothetical protein